MLVTIIQDIQAFMLIVVILIFGFAVAFVVNNADTVQKTKGTTAVGNPKGYKNKLGPYALVDSSHFILDVAVFNTPNAYLDNSSLNPFQPPSTMLNTVLYISVMITVNIILLNLLIAIMANSYARVQKSAHRGEQTTDLLKVAQMPFLLYCSACRSFLQRSWLLNLKHVQLFILNIVSLSVPGRGPL